MRLLLSLALLATATAHDAPVADERLVREWWQWLRGNANAPAHDKTGAACAVGQSGPVWHLAGSIFAERMRRTCTVPAGKYIFFPLITLAYNPDVPGGISCEGAKAQIAPLHDKAAGLHAQLDGRLITPVRLRTAQCFDLFARQPGKHKETGFPTAADGYWVLLQPLPKGRHTLKFGGRYDWPTGAYPDATQDIEYELVVN